MSNRLVLVLGLLLVGHVAGFFQSIGEATDNVVTLTGEVLAVNRQGFPSDFNDASSGEGRAGNDCGGPGPR